MDRTNDEKASDLSEAARIEKLRLVGKRLGYWRHGYSLPYVCRQIFEDIDLNDRSVLEIGCGKGIFGYWASLQGARRFVGLEPLEEGSFDSTQIYSEHKHVVDELGYKNNEILPNTIQDFGWKGEPFDVVLSMASVNHLDEDSCVRLRESAQAREKYVDIFRQIAEMTKPAGKLIVMDCANRNLFGDLGITNPLARTIEWEKHQAPEYWAELLKLAGFKEPRISWPSGKILSRLGINSRGRLLNYLTTSFFRLEMTRG